MRQFTKEERIFIEEEISRTGKVRSVLNAWPNQFPNTRLPSRRAIYNIKQKFHLHGTVLNRNKSNSGRPRTGRSANHIADVRRDLQANPRLSTRRNNCPHIPRTTFRRIITHDIEWHPYKILKRHGLQPGDPNRRLQFCNWLVNRARRFLDTAVVVDEANFQMDGSVSSQNVRMYAPKGNPPRDFAFNVPHDKRKVSVLAAVTGNNRLIGPIFVDQNINGNVYLDIINDQLEPQLVQIFGQQANGAIRRAWFFQDGAPAHRLIAVRDRLQELFPHRVVGLGHHVEWPPRSPDLTPLDFWLWGDVKASVYAEGPPRNLRELRRRITDAFTRIRRTRVTSRAVHHMYDRAMICIREQGGHVEGR